MAIKEENSRGRFPNHGVLLGKKIMLVCQSNGARGGGGGGNGVNYTRQKAVDLELN